MAIAFVQSFTPKSGAVPQTTASSTTTSGNTIIVVTAVNASAASEITSVTDSKSNTYTKAVERFYNFTYSAIWYCTNITGGASHTITASGVAGNNICLVAQEFSGLDTGTVLDQSTGTTGDSNTLATGTTGTTSLADELIVNGFASGSGVSITVGAGYSNLSQIALAADVAGAIQSKIVSATGTQVGSATTTGVPSFSGVIATFKMAGGAAVVQHNLMLMGVGA